MKKIVWFSAFRNVVPADYENWLETMASQGWNLDKITQFSSIKITFQKTAPKKYRYVFDLNAFPTKTYRDTYEQFGWEYMGKMSSCFIWRKAYTDSRPESFTDTESLIKRNKRVRNAVTACLILFIAAILVSLAAIGICAQTGKTEKILGLSLETAFIFLLTLYLWQAARKIQKYIEK